MERETVEDRVAIVDLASDLGVRKQWLFKIVRRLGIRSTPRRESEHGGQNVATVTREEAGLIRREVAQAGSRAREQATPAGDGARPYGLGDEAGFFYIVQLEPEQDQGRFKVGFTLELDARLRKHHTAAPFATYLKTWPCRRAWERAAIDCITAGCEQLHTEVFRAKSLPDIQRRADEFFSLMPAP